MFVYNPVYLWYDNTRDKLVNYMGEQEKDFSFEDQQGGGVGLMKKPKDRQIEDKDKPEVPEKELETQVQKPDISKEAARIFPDVGEEKIETEIVKPEVSVDKWEKADSRWLSWYAKHADQIETYYDPTDEKELRQRFENETRWYMRHQRFFNDIDKYAQTLDVSKQRRKNLDQDIELFKASYGSQDKVQMAARASFVEKINTLNELKRINEENRLRNQQIIYTLQGVEKKNNIATPVFARPKPIEVKKPEIIQDQAATGKKKTRSIWGRVKGLFSRKKKTQAEAIEIAQPLEILKASDTVSKIKVAENDYKNEWQTYQQLVAKAKAEDKVTIWQGIYKKYNEDIWEAQRNIDKLKTDPTAKKELLQAYEDRNDAFEKMNKEAESVLS